MYSTITFEESSLWSFEDYLHSKMMNSENEVLEAQLKISFYFMKKSCSDPELFIIIYFHPHH